MAVRFNSFKPTGPYSFWSSEHSKPGWYNADTVAELKEVVDELKEKGTEIDTDRYNYYNYFDENNYTRSAKF